MLDLKTEQKRKEIIRFFIKNNLLISQDFLDDLSEADILESNQGLLDLAKQKDALVLDKALRSNFSKNSGAGVCWRELEKSKTYKDLGRDNKSYSHFVDYLLEHQDTQAVHGDIENIEQNKKVQIISSYEGKSRKIGVQDFVQHLNLRYRFLEGVLSKRQELTNILSVSRVLQKKERETVSIIGVVESMQYTKNNNIILNLEDPTGKIKVLVNQNKPELFEQAQTIVPDEVIAVIGVNGDNIVFSNNILWPEVPLNRELKKSPEEEYALFLSDLHIGSNNFLPREFDKFISWMNQTVGNETQREISKKVKYVFIVGDLVDGVGIYPGQEEELVINDVKQQYAECARYLKQIPSDVAIIICPGNHDAQRISEPQPALRKEFVEPLLELPNVTLVSNPAYVCIGKTEDFSGFVVLLYHGFSFDYYVANVDYIRAHGGYDRADVIMKFLLRKRHLAPTHTSSLYQPDLTSDNLVITQIPDFFVTGHIHKSVISHYRNITLISGSCWQSKTSFQQKVGHNPEPARVPLVNLQTREAKILRFG